MGRFLFFTTAFMIVIGFLLHFEIDIPFFSFWIGKLPGDFVIHNNKMTIHFPVISAAFLSFFASFIIWLFTPKKKKDN